MLQNPITAPGNRAKTPTPSPTGPPASCLGSERERERERERESESERRKSGRSRERDEARDRSRLSSYTRIPDITYPNTEKVQLHFYVKDSDDIGLTTSNPDTYEQIKRAVVNRTAKFHWHCSTFSYEKIFAALISNNTDWGKVQFSKISDDRVRAMKNELCNQ